MNDNFGRSLSFWSPPFLITNGIITWKHLLKNGWFERRESKRRKNKVSIFVLLSMRNKVADNAKEVNTKNTNNNFFPNRSIFISPIEHSNQKSNSKLNSKNRYRLIVQIYIFNLCNFQNSAIVCYYSQAYLDGNKTPRLENTIFKKESWFSKTQNWQWRDEDRR